MYGDARNWKWIIPGFFTVVTFVLAVQLSAELGAVITAILYGFSGVFFGAALINLWKFVSNFLSNDLYTIKKAMSMSQDALILQNIGNAHPETIRIVFGERMRVWMRKAGIDLPEGVEPHDVLYARPEVTIYFFMHFLRHSNNFRCMAMRELSDKSYRFDPLRKVTDREQYEMLVEYFQQRHILTRESPTNGTPLWISPWTPALVAEDFGYEWEHETLPDLAEQEGIQ